MNSAETEYVLFPGLPIIDSHHHLWNRPGFRYLAGELLADMKTGHNVVAGVFVECESGYRTQGPPELMPVGETQFVLDQIDAAKNGAAERNPVASAIVGFADLTAGTATREVLEAHQAIGGARFKGVRFQSNWDESGAIRRGAPAIRPGMLRERAVQEGLRAVSEMGLTFDSYVFFNQLLDICEVADRLPNLRIVLNHCGGPLTYGPYADQKTDHYVIWRRNLEEVALRSNVFCKIGGLLSRTTAYNYIDADRPARSRDIAEAWKKWIEPCIEAFGAGRCMFGSNFPVDKMGVSYSSLWNVYKHSILAASDAERGELFYGTASRIYGLSGL
ncbi:amidohydrolase family protein [Paraburkholderia fynbosensis]|uniref:amidohydrolase family protein n=1 Tax=Paraburkholderia fynbosensis TaxID=1200993 RepID=UPI001C2E2303|nr:amidohydrolase family protein [Paraburkholderia fynbosensis]